MNYTIVKQFYNNFIDNFFNFFVRIADFGKLMVEVFWAFYDILETFFLIFYNLYMYFYYIILFVIDKSTESRSGTILFWRRLPTRAAYKPQKTFVKDIINPVPSMYGRQSSSSSGTVSQAAVSTIRTAATAAKTTTSTLKSAADRLKSSPRGAKKPLLRSLLEALSSFFSALWGYITLPFRKIGTALSRRMKPVHEDTPEGKKSLIQEYLKEYEQKRNR